MCNNEIEGAVTVKELIAELLQYNQDLPVVTEYEGTYMPLILDVIDVQQYANLGSILHIDVNYYT